jgi:hypothetical protein
MGAALQDVSWAFEGLLSIRPKAKGIKSSLAFMIKTFLKREPSDITLRAVQPPGGVATECLSKP